MSQWPTNWNIQVHKLQMTWRKQQPKEKKSYLLIQLIRQSKAIMPEFRSQMDREEEDSACEFRYKIGILAKE